MQEGRRSGQAEYFYYNGGSENIRQLVLALERHSAREIEEALVG